MKKKGLLIAGAATAVLAGVALHSYLDVMYKETIPKGIAKRLQEHFDNGDMIPLGEFTDKSNEWNDQQPFETIAEINPPRAKADGLLSAGGDRQ